MNLERSLRVGDRLGGHFVQGHVDATAALRGRREEGEWSFLAFEVDPGWTPLMVPKGSIAVDGVSLTLVDVDPGGFSVMLIPHTLAVTTLGGLAPGDRVNIEADMIAKHVAKLLTTPDRGPRPMPVHRQTQSYLRNLFARRGIAPQHRFGQNFLIDLNIHELIANAADVGPDDVVLEVGPGAGALTALMASRGAAVVAVEIDPGMARLTADATAGMPNVRVVVGDALANKHTMHPEVLDNLRAGLAVDPGRRLKLVANLPYNVATPIVSNLLVHPELCPSLMVVTIQLELAERMRAEPGTDAYGSLSVIVQALADCSIVRVLPPSVFWPRPKVDSAVIAITPDPAKRAAIGDLAWFHAGRPQDLPAPPQEPQARPVQPLARPLDQGGGRRDARRPRPDRPGPRRGHERRGAHRPDRRPQGQAGRRQGHPTHRYGHRHRTRTRPGERGLRIPPRQRSGEAQAPGPPR